MGSNSSNCTGSASDDIKYDAQGIIPVETARKMRQDGIHKRINTKIREACETGATWFDLDLERMPHEEYVTTAKMLENRDYEVEHCSRSTIRVHIISMQK